RAALADLRTRLAGGDRPGLCKELLATSTDGRVKLYVTHAALVYRREHPQLFDAGGYRPLRAIGRRRRHVCAFARDREGEAAIVVAPRLGVRLTGGAEAWPRGRVAWRETWLGVRREGVGRRVRGG